MSPENSAAAGEGEDRVLWRWLGPLAALLVFGIVVLILHREFAHLHLKDVLAHLHSIPRRQILAALLFTTLSYWLLTTYEVLALRYLRRVIPYTTLFRSRTPQLPGVRRGDQPRPLVPRPHRHARPEIGRAHV